MPDWPKPMDESATRELVRRIQTGEEAAWTELYRLYKDELLFLTRARLGPKLRSALQSEDIVQSVALEAFRELQRFEVRGPGSLRRFLHGLVLNKIRDRADTYSAAKRAGAVALTDAHAESLAAREEASPYSDPGYERLERALAALPDEMREVILLRRIEELSSQEVAERLGKSDDAVRKLYSRALARLALLVGDGDGG
ncbi:MAG: sigma-70 family RNA polymerase sigma factor [Planctomycetes bacterium]|nr:sigma-70 family RNA polymerase sigma factor [Planctomycetota bacterium]